MKKAIFPMLAHDYRKHYQKMIFPFAVSRKIDGIRAITEDIDSEIVMISRLGKPFTYISKVKEDIRMIYNKFPGVVFDGEIYSHEISFSRISGAVRKTKEASVDDHLLEYWIFDIINDKAYSERIQMMKKIEKYYKAVRPNQKQLKFVYYDTVVSKNEVEMYHNLYVKQGFEGVICRNLDGKYVQKFRSYDLQKYKNFEDNEFKIVDTKEGRGSEKGAIIFECVCGTHVFDVRPRGSIDKRKEMWKQKDTYIGKMLTVRYQNTGIQEDGALPRFPVGIEVRDYE